MTRIPSFLPRWRKASFSDNLTNCVEVAMLEDGRIGVRHSKEPEGPQLVFTCTEWAAFIDGAVHGEFHLDALTP